MNDPMMAIADQFADIDRRLRTIEGGQRIGVNIRSGAGTPESVVVAPVGSLFLRLDGGAGTTLYIKESGTGATGWVGK